ncbi:hypothetical protein R6Q59_023131 [Mikania micrantha]|uniref:Cytochrome P450 n=1 Tax=Mikania micrantha TaxID=192012 RepID=A0A5N6MZ76_9ASTR|nr:hypothetical protein E3N88_28350 [Mikania micrantha]
MDIFTLSSLVIITISCILLWKKKSSSGFNLPPGPPSLPIIGNLHQIIGKSLSHTIMNMSQKYGPIILLHFGSQPFVVISSSKLATQAFQTHDNVLCNRPYSRNLKRLAFNYNDIVFSPYDDHYKHMRKTLVVDFLNSRMTKSFKKVLDSELKRLIDSLPFDKEVHFDKMISNFMVDYVCKIVAGKSYGDVTLGGKKLIDMLHEMAILFSGSFSEMFPSVGWVLEDLSGWTRRVDNHMTNFDALIGKMIDEHIDHTNADEKDLIDVCKSSLTREEMKAIMTNVFNGSVDTSYLTLVWVMSMLVKNPRVMHKLQAEIRSHSGKKPRLDETDTAKMMYLKNVIKETLRLHGPSPFLITRHCVEHIQIGGYDILPGTNVLICSRGIAKDPTVWTENVNEFYPERFENRVVDQFDMTPFGGGRRSCPGFNLATSTLEVVVANLFNNIDWKPPNGMRNEDLDVEEDEEGSLLVAKKTPLYLVPVKHNSQA